MSVADLESIKRLSRIKAAGPPERTVEIALLNSGAATVAGVDEAGRGSLAGPVVAAAVVLPRQGCPEGLDDSKRLDPRQRLYLFHQILNTALGVGVHFVGPSRIDEVNILRASHEAMRGAVLSLSIIPEMALIDGLPLSHFPCPHQAIVGGDGLECSIAAASIVAKVTRDHLMALYGYHYPLYTFERHKGYATPTHRAAIRQHGLSPIHRLSFTKAFQSLPDGTLDL